MRVGIVILPDRWWPEQRPKWQAAEAYGFDHAWTYDHLGWRPQVDGPWFSSVPVLACAAGWTSTIRLGTLVASPNFRRPVPFAREVMTLDDVSGGRFILGLGCGDAGYDAAALGTEQLEVADRIERYEEFVGLLDTLLTAEMPVTHEGAHYSAYRAATQPGCVQWPRVPFLCASDDGRTMPTVARHAQGWVTLGPSEADPERWWRGLARLSDRLDQELAALGKDPAALDRYLVPDPKGPVYALSSVEAFHDVLGRAAEAGFTDLVTHWPREEGPFAGSVDVLEAVAANGLVQA